MPPTMGETERIYWATLALEDRKTALPSLRRRAEQWTRTLATLVGLLAVVGITLSPRALDGRTLPGVENTNNFLQVLVPLLLLSTLGFLTAALYQAFRAMTGDPRWKGYDPVIYRDEYHKETKKTHELLNSSRFWATFAGGALALYALLVAVSVPRQAQYVRVTTPEGLYCGTLYESEPLTEGTDTTKVTTKNGTPTTEITRELSAAQKRGGLLGLKTAGAGLSIPALKITALEPVSDCLKLAVKP